MQKDKLKINIYSTREEMGRAAATDVVNKIVELLKVKETVNIIFAAAPSQNEFLAALSESGIDWTKVNAFHMDEYAGLPEDAPQLFGNFLRNAFFNKVNLRSVYFINGNSGNSEEECGRYSALLDKYPTDIVCMGIGENGHIAFNDPPVADFNDSQKVKLVELDHECRQQQVNDGCFSTLDKVPSHALTLTIPALMAAEFVYCMVPGKTKDKAVFNTLNKEIISQYPSTVLRRHDHAVLYLDKLSSNLLTSMHST